MATILLIVGLSTVSLGYIAHLLRLPYRPEHHLVPVANIVVAELPDTTLDWIGLV